MSFFLLLKTVHVLSAIVAVGTSLTYRFLLAGANRQPEALVYTLRTIRRLDMQLANPAYGLLLLSGLAMALTVPFPLTTPWILTALVIYGSVMVLGIAVYAPVFRRQVQLAESEGLQGTAYRAAARQGNIIGLLVTALAVVIVVLMVAKPVLWGG